MLKIHGLVKCFPQTIDIKLVASESAMRAPEASGGEKELKAERLTAPRFAEWRGKPTEWEAIVTLNGTTGLVTQSIVNY